ncbi:hypothetical protein MATL_G00108460 [Megalops atlanticus]|uniref:Uncharacterized protein n=1 Tax=Megalops atlanticus TaxID=7932 RepID=A0A9D3Q0F0_MEGAT|nr:hypothetical protein MATL_G00108460 [Megalops atlanticus]
MFALLGNFNHPDRRQRAPQGGEGGEGGGRTLVSSTGQSASAIYLTTLATPALLLREAGAEALRDALGLSQEAPSPSPSSPAFPAEEGSGDWALSLSLLNELLEDGQLSLEEDEEEDEADLRRGQPARRRTNSIPCDCSDFVRDETFGAAI